MITNFVKGLLPSPLFSSLNLQAKFFADLRKFPGLGFKLIDREISDDEIAVTQRGALGLTRQGHELAHLVHVRADVTLLDSDALFGKEIQGLRAPWATGFDVKSGQRLRHLAK